MSTTPHYPIAAVSRLTGLSLDTIRAWERRHQAVEPKRGPRGRVYTDAQVTRLRLLASLVRLGHSIGQVAALSSPQLQALLDRTPGGEVADVPAPGDSDSGPVARILDEIRRLDHVAIDREVSRLASLLAPRAFVYDVALPLMREVGERWYANRLSIAEEHMASAVMHGVMGTMLRLHAPARPTTSLLFTSPEGERHEFGLLAAAMLTGAAGVGVVYLGPGLPASDIAEAARVTGVVAVVVAATGRSPVVLAQVPRIREAVAPEVELWVGGAESPALTLDARRRKGVVALPAFEDFERHLRRVGGR